MSREIIQSLKQEIEITKQTGRPLNPSFYESLINTSNKSIFFDLVDNWEPDFAEHLPRNFTDPLAAHQCFLERRDGLDIVGYARAMGNDDAVPFFDRLRLTAITDTSRAIAGLKAQIQKIEEVGAQNFGEGMAKVLFRAGQDLISSGNPLHRKHGYTLIKEAVNYVAYSHDFGGDPKEGEDAGHSCVSGMHKYIQEEAEAESAPAHGGASASAAAAAVAASASADSSEYASTPCLGDSSTADFHGE